MSSFFEIVLALIAGFSAGCLVTTLITVSIYLSQQKKLEERAEIRRMVINSIGKLCANVDNAFSAFRIGTMNFGSLREIIIQKIDEINTVLNSNIENLDLFYIKNIQRFIEDQKRFLLRKQGGDEADVPEHAVRSVSRTGSYPIEGSSFQKPIPAPLPTEIPVAPVAKKAAPAKAAPKKKEMPSAPKAQEKHVADALSAFELGATTRIPLDTIKQFQESQSSIPQSDIQSAPTQELDANAFNVFKLPDVPVFSPEVTKDKKSKAGTPEVAPVSFDNQPQKGMPVFSSGPDIESTQEYNISDLFEKSKTSDQPASRFAPVRQKEKPAPAQGAFFAPDEAQKSAPKKKNVEDDSLITGEDVMDQMDSFFGIE